MINLLAMSWGQWFLAWLLIMVSCLLMLVVLVQRGRGGGLVGAFGGAGGMSAFGAKTGDVFTWITVGLAGFFVLMAVVGNWVFTPQAPVTTAPGAGTLLPTEPVTQPAPNGQAETPDAGTAPADDENAEEQPVEPPTSPDEGSAGETGEAPPPDAGAAEDTADEPAADPGATAPGEEKPEEGAAP